MSAHAIDLEKSNVDFFRWEMTWNAPSCDISSVSSCSSCSIIIKSTAFLSWIRKNWVFVKFQQFVRNYSIQNNKIGKIERCVCVWIRDCKDDKTYVCFRHFDLLEDVWNYKKKILCKADVIPLQMGSTKYSYWISIRYPNGELRLKNEFWIDCVIV